MKKILTLVILALSTTICANAQDSQKNMNVGAGGVETAKIYISTFDQTGAHMGISAGRNVIGIVNQNSYATPELEYRITYGSNVGLEFGYNFTRFIGLQMEAYYSKQGQKYKDEIIGMPVVSRKVTTHYFQMPLMVKYIGGQSNIQLYVMAGPQFSVLINDELKMNGHIIEPNMINETVKQKSFYENFEWGVKLATGADIKIMERLYLNAGLAFYGGLTDINIQQFRTNGNAFEIKPYKKSTNAYAGVNVGLHYQIRRTSRGN